MAGSKPRIARNQGRIEFLASRDFIVSLVEQGFDKKKIFARLQKEHSITMSYAAFCRAFQKFYPQQGYVDELKKEPTQSQPVPRSPAVQAAPSEVRPGPRKITSTFGKTTDPRTLDIDSVI